MRGAILCVLWAGLSAAVAAPPQIEVPAEFKPYGQYVEMVPKTDAVSVVYVGLDGVEPFPAHWSNDPTAFRMDCRGLPKGRYRFAVVAASKTGEQVRRETVLVVGDAPPVPPGPTPPGPTPPDPTPPQPVASFRVIVVYESADTLTAEQRGVVYGAAVEKFLTENCTGGAGGWRRRDKDAPGDQDKAMAALWDAVKPKVTATPCLAIAVNDKVTLEPLPATPAAAVELLKKYREGR